MTRYLTAVLLIGCASEASGSPKSVPSGDVLCQIWEGNVPDNVFELRGYGTLDSDVVAAWGEPSSRSGNVWTYEWAGLRATAVTLTFEEAALCYNGGKNITGSWVIEIEAEGISRPACWNYGQRKDEPTCDGCIEFDGVSKCL